MKNIDGLVVRLKSVALSGNAYSKAVPNSVHFSERRRYVTQTSATVTPPGNIHSVSFLMMRYRTSIVLLYVALLMKCD